LNFNKNELHLKKKIPLMARGTMNRVFCSLF
jgi:hypothetical protein